MPPVSHDHSSNHDANWLQSLQSTGFRNGVGGRRHSSTHVALIVTLGVFNDPFGPGKAAIKVVIFTSELLYEISCHTELPFHALLPRVESLQSDGR